MKTRWWVAIGAGVLCVVIAMLIAFNSGREREVPRTPLPGVPQRDTTVGQTSGHKGQIRSLGKNPKRLPPIPPVVSLHDRWLASVQGRDLETLRQLEAEALLDPEDSTAWLLSELNGNGPLTDQQEFAARLLARIGTPEAVAALLSRYEQLAIDGMDTENLRSLIETIRNPAAAEGLLDYAVKCSDAQLYESVVRAVAGSADDNLLEALCEDLEAESNSRMLFVSETVLEHVPPGRVAGQFQSMLNTVTNPSSLRFVAGRLGDDGSESSIEALLHALDSAQGEARTVLLDGVFRIHAIESLPILEAIAVGNGARDVRKFAIYAMANYPLATVNPTLQRLLANSAAGEMQKQIRYVQSLLEKQQNASLSAGN